MTKYNCFSGSSFSIHSSFLLQCRSFPLLCLEGLLALPQPLQASCSLMINEGLSSRRRRRSHAFCEPSAYMHMFVNTICHEPMYIPSTFVHTYVLLRCMQYHHAQHLCFPASKNIGHGLYYIILDLPIYAGKLSIVDPFPDSVQHLKNMPTQFPFCA